VEEIEKSAASVEEAIEAALEELGLSEQEARIEIVQDPKQGFLGLSSQPAVVRVRRASGTNQDDELAPEDVEEQADLAMEFLRGLLDSMGLDAELEINASDGVTYIEVWAASSQDDVGLLIGRRGHNLESLQELVRAYVQHQTGERCHVQVDVEDYRKRRLNLVASKARDAARRVRKTGRPESLEPMSAYERKIVHDTVAALGGLETMSEGEEPARHVVIRKRR
jgi:spoIIIJ-associated protein